MELRRNLTGGLAWAGLVIVVAVPAVEAVRSKLVHAGPAQTIAAIEAPTVVAPVTYPTVTKKAAAVAVTPRPDVAVTPPVAVSSVRVAPTPAMARPVVDESPASGVADEARKAAPVTASPVAAVASQAPAVATSPGAASSKDTALDQYLASGKPLPSYLKASPAAVESAPPPAEAQPPDSTPSAPAQMATTDDSASTTLPADTSNVIAPPPVPMPVAARPKIAAQRLVTEADLKGWKSGSLADFLRQRGLISPTDAGEGSSN